MKTISKACHKVASYSLAIVLSAYLLSGCSLNPIDVNDDKSPAQFEPMNRDILPTGERYRRKWDGPVVVDLDQDGLQDLILTDHGNELNVYWNLGGRYSQPTTLLTRDIHGVVAADYDKDGKIEIVIAQGGGDGKNPKFPLLFEVNEGRKILKQNDMKHFEFTRGRAINFIDADNDGTLELITTGFPLKSQKAGANHLYKLDNNEQYQFVKLLPQAKWLGYRLQTVDYNNDGFKDLLFYGGADIVAVTNKGKLDFVDDTKDVLGALNQTNHVSSINEIDFDNDGDDDLFITRAEHQFSRQQFYDASSKRFAFFTFKKQKQQFDLSIIGNFELKNLQMAYPDFDVFVGKSMRKLEFESDRHSHKDVTLTQQQATGWPSKPTKKGIYIGYLGDNTWRLLVDTRARNAGVILNVENNLGSTTIAPYPPKLFENKGGRFVDASDKLGNAINEQTTSSAVADFNNDGWPDMVVIKYGNMATKNKQFLLFNDKGIKFTTSEVHNIVSDEIGATGNGANVLDYDKDGDIDLLYANERGLWHLFSNNLVQGQSTHFIGFVVGQSPAKKIDQLDAKVTIWACNQMQQTTISNGGNAFSQSLNNQVHFGLGECKSVQKVRVKWRNGEQTELHNLTVNQYHLVK
ncbi:CRTAC1 family protein [Psychrosphaera sp. B3R10]|nr:MULTISPECIES: CRTAC1 family protein [unclassified Psychrosphaera]MBU2881763.1 CRTAC1 family protein [Psychrosphaera sp. I2R16]MBU2990152.1 CRTAC1 family protein [Psychrosphaera sp. B3R10]